MKNIPLDKDEIYDAIRDAVKEVFLELTQNMNSLQFQEAIKEGVQSAIWQVATNATDMPCADFYDSIQKGVEKAMEFKDICLEKE